MPTSDHRNARRGPSRRIGGEELKIGFRSMTREALYLGEHGKAVAR